MAQISKGTTYSDGMLVTSANLNAHVANATLLGGAISEQASADSVATTDLLLLNQGAGVGTLKKATVAQVLANVATTGYVKTDGSVAMTGNLTLPATAPSSTQAVSRAWVEGYVSAGTLGYTPVNKAGDTMTGDLTMSGSSTVVLARNPSTNLEAVPRQYLDAAVSTLATQSALTTHTGNTSNPHSVTAAQVGLGNVNNTSDAAKPVSTAQQTALDLKLNISGGTLTGPLGLPAGDPPASNSATSKAYVDAGLANKVNTSGGTFDGSFVYTGTLQRTTTPSDANDVVNKSYIDSIPRVVATVWFSTNQGSATTIATDSTVYLGSGGIGSVTCSRTVGSNSLVVSYTLPNSYPYNSSTEPFFLTGQYVGIIGITGVTGKLYKIESTSGGTYTGTFTVTTTETTALSGAAIKLSQVHNSSSLIWSPYSKNIKSIYWNPTGTSKYYINYIADTVTGSKTTPPSADPAYIRKSNVIGSALEATSTSFNNSLQAMMCFGSGRTTYIDNANTLEGFDSTTMGCEIAFMRAYNAGAVNALTTATVSIVSWQ